MEFYVEQDVCIGCGLCIDMVPEVFRFNDDGKSEVYEQPKGDEAANASQALSSCPVDAIKEK